MNVILQPLASEGSTQMATCVRKPRFNIGRAEDCDLRLADAWVSRRHCQLIVTPHGVRIRDTGSRHGTFVNSRLVENECELRHGDTLHVALAAFRVEIQRQPAQRRLALSKSPLAGLAACGERLWSQTLAYLRPYRRRRV